MPLSAGGSDSGATLLPYYAIAERAFPVLADTAVVLPDTAVGTFGLAWYRGLDTKGTTDPHDDEPRFQVRDDIDVDAIPYVGFHESGHAFQETVARYIAQRRGVYWLDVFDEIRTRYWAMRGFPGTWMDAQIKASNGAGWNYYPDESFADCFAWAMLTLHPIPGYVTGEWTWNYNMTPIWQTPDKAVNFMNELAAEAEGDDMTPAQEAKLDRVLALLEAEGPKVWTARAQRLLDVEQGDAYNPNRAPLDPRIKA
jgi:hypothetical protein